MVCEREHLLLIEGVTKVVYAGRGASKAGVLHVLSRTLHSYIFNTLPILFMVLLQAQQLM